MLLVVDANVLIDYARVRVDVLQLAAAHLGIVHVPSVILAEVDQLTAADCRRLGLEVVDPTEAQVFEAGGRGGRLTFEDRICLVLARDNGWTCVTNDKRLRTECESTSVAVLWGLEVMVLLVERGALAAADALAVAHGLHADNPFHISRSIVERFEARIRALTVP